jgi:hypothetical protein
VAKYLAGRDPAVHVEHNALLRGKLSDSDRQIDALMRGTVGGLDVLIVAECKRTAGQRESALSTRWWYETVPTISASTWAVTTHHEAQKRP